MRGYHLTLVLLAGAAAALAAAQASVAEYRDPQGRFRFTYPAAWGTPSPGTNDGHGGRYASVRFPGFPAPLGGELVLTRGFPTVDLQAMGGLYDSIALEVLPDGLRRRVLARLPRLTSATFCDALGRATHLDVSPQTLPEFSEQERAAIRRLDLMRSINPQVRLCRPGDGAIEFVREVAFEQGGPRQFLFGAIRFLDSDVSTVQLVAAAPNRGARIVNDISSVVRSVRF